MFKYEMNFLKIVEVLLNIMMRRDIHVYVTYVHVPKYA